VVTLLAGTPQRSRATVQDEQQARLPDLQRVRQEQHAPQGGDQHEQGLGRLDQAAAVVSVGQRAEVHGEQQERHPVADDLEAGQGGEWNFCHSIQ
jgi:hypothetical protein